MNVVAGVVAIVFGLLHGLPSIAQLRAPTAARGSHEPGAVPRWARILWLCLATVTVVGGVMLWVSPGAVAAIVTALGALGVFFLAIANGFWMHGRPNVTHHVVRGIAVGGLIALAALSVSGSS